MLKLWLKKLWDVNGTSLMIQIEETLVQIISHEELIKLIYPSS